jgi:hypothetical protein
MDERNEPEYQARWEPIEPEPRRNTGRKDGTSGRNFMDTDAFRRLAKRGFDGRPKDTREESDK